MKPPVWFVIVVSLLRSVPVGISGFLISHAIKHHDSTVVVMGWVIMGSLLAAFWMDTWMEFLHRSKAMRSVDLAPGLNGPDGEVGGGRDVKPLR